MNCSKCILAIFYCTCTPAGLQMNSVCIQCKDFAYKKWQNLFLWLLMTPNTYGFAHLRHTSALVHWPILHNIILLLCTCIFCACTVYTRGWFVPEQKPEPIFNLGHCSWKLKQFINYESCHGLCRWMNITPLHIVRSSEWFLTAVLYMVSIHYL